MIFNKQNLNNVTFAWFYIEGLGKHSLTICRSSLYSEAKLRQRLADCAQDIGMNFISSHKSTYAHTNTHVRDAIRGDWICLDGRNSRRRSRRRCHRRRSRRRRRRRRRRRHYSQLCAGKQITQLVCADSRATKIRFAPTATRPPPNGLPLPFGFVWWVCVCVCRDLWMAGQRKTS